MEPRGIEAHGYMVIIWSINIFPFYHYLYFDLGYRMPFGGRCFIDVERIVNLMIIIIFVFIVIIIDIPLLLVSDELESYVLKHDCIYVTVSIASNCVEIC